MAQSEENVRVRATVLVPIYNAERYLEETLDSVFAQTSREWELVLVDDGSSDGSVAIARRYVEHDPERVTLIHDGMNRGVAEARNIGVAHSRGELVFLLDCDDILLPECVERCLQLYDDAGGADAKVGIIAPNAYILTDDGKTAETWAERFGWRDDVDLDAMMTKNYIFARAAFSRAAYDSAGPFAVEVAAPGSPASDDYDMWVRILEQGFSAVTTREPLSKYRVHATNLSQQRGKVSRNTIKVQQRALARGRLTPVQRRRARRRIRHVRALARRADLREAIARRKPVAIAGRAAIAVPYGLVALLQDPGRWGEWARGLKEGGRGTTGLGRDPR